jgi:hypothetical protein
MLLSLWTHSFHFIWLLPMMNDSIKIPSRSEAYKSEAGHCCAAPHNGIPPYCCPAHARCQAPSSSSSSLHWLSSKTSIAYNGDNEAVMAHSSLDNGNIKNRASDTQASEGTATATGGWRCSFGSCEACCADASQCSTAYRGRSGVCCGRRGNEPVLL